MQTFVKFEKKYLLIRINQEKSEKFRKIQIQIPSASAPLSSLEFRSNATP